MALKDPTLEIAQRLEIRDKKCASCKHGASKYIFGRQMWLCKIGKRFPACMRHEGKPSGYQFDGTKHASETWTHDCPHGGRILIAVGYTCDKCGADE